VSSLGIWEVALTLALFVILYSVLAVVEFGLLLKYIRKGPPEATEDEDAAIPTISGRLSPRPAPAE
jgi:cytochrome d ubiquinol oxidase subunit I